MRISWAQDRRGGNEIIEIFRNWVIIGGNQRVTHRRHHGVRENLGELGRGWMELIMAKSSLIHDEAQSFVRSSSPPFSSLLWPSLTLLYLFLLAMTDSSEDSYGKNNFRSKILSNRQYLSLRSSTDSSDRLAVVMEWLGMLGEGIKTIWRSYNVKFGFLLFIVRSPLI